MPFLHLERACTCTFLCLCRPEIEVTLVEEGKNEYIGKIKSPFACCDIVVEIYDNKD